MGIMYQNYPKINNSVELLSFSIESYTAKLLGNVESDTVIKFNYILTVYSNTDSDFIEPIIFVYSGWSSSFASNEKPYLGTALGQQHFYYGSDVRWDNQNFFLLRAVKIFKEKFNIQSKILTDGEAYAWTEIMLGKFQQICCLFHYKIMWETSSYLEIDEYDRALSKLWLTDLEKNSHACEAKMLSARFAEKIAMKFYESIEHNVEDISINQLKGKSQDWKLFDILLDDKFAIDVKNSRNPVSNKNRYVDYCIPKFKKDRCGNRVKIAGVMSPYLDFDYLNHPLKINHFVNNIIYLGETNEGIIDKISENFTTENLQVEINNKHVLPPWIFDYPDRYYNNKKIEIDRLKSIFEKNDDNLIFFINELSKRFLKQSNDIIPILLIVRIDLKYLNIELEITMKEWEIDFFKRIIYQEKLIMPVLFLCIISHFIDTIKSVNLNYSPIDYKKFLFFEKDEQFLFPLGIADPLKIINSLIDTLTILWVNNIKSKDFNFKNFKLKGLGLLEGKRHDSDKYETIIAYCGGFIYGKIKCGNSPLIIGREKTCGICGKLICSVCNYCSSSCQIKNDPLNFIQTENKIVWCRDSSGYCLYVEGKKITEVTNSWMGNDLLVYHSTSNTYYLLEDYKNVAENQFRPAKIVVL